MIGAGARNRPLLGDLHAFRGFAIVAIVGAHCSYAFVEANGGSETDTPGRRAITALAETLFHDSTLFFALISGLLFSMVLRGRPWREFFGKKVLHVALPYTFISLVYVLLNANWTTATAPALAGHWLASLPTGKGASFHLWYIPVLFVLYAATPLLTEMTKRRWAQLPLALIVLAPLVISRVWGHWTWATPVYFLGAYAAGVWAGTQYPVALKLVAASRGVLWLAVALTTPTLVALFLSDADRIGPVDGRETLFYVQKMALAGLVLLALNKVAAHPPAVLLRLGDQAFPIYFLHIIPIMGVEVVLPWLTSRPLTDWQVAAGTALMLPLLLTVTWIIAQVLTAALGPWSRNLIGAQGRPRAVGEVALQTSR